MEWKWAIAVQMGFLMCGSGHVMECMCALRESWLTLKRSFKSNKHVISISNKQFLIYTLFCVYLESSSNSSVIVRFSPSGIFSKLQRNQKQKSGVQIVIYSPPLSQSPTLAFAFIIPNLHISCRWVPFGYGSHYLTYLPGWFVELPDWNA